jgi:hypothetical protein
MALCPLCETCYLSLFCEMMMFLVVSQNTFRRNGPFREATVLYIYKANNGKLLSVLIHAQKKHLYLNNI